MFLYFKRSLKKTASCFYFIFCNVFFLGCTSENIKFFHLFYFYFLFIYTAMITPCMAHSADYTIKKININDKIIVLLKKLDNVYKNLYILYVIQKKYNKIKKYLLFYFICYKICAIEMETNRRVYHTCVVKGEFPTS